MKNKKVIVTGGMGFIGSHLVDKLVENNEVIVLDNGSSGSNVNDKAQYFSVDLAKEKPQTLKFHLEGADYVFHLAAWGRMPMCLEDPVGAYENNVMATVHVLEAAKQARVKKVVLSSSCIVYCEETPYKSSKVALEDIARVYRDIYGLPTISLRYANVYGTRQVVGQDSAMFAMLKDSYNKEGKVHIFGDGEQTRDWTHVYDIARANIIAAESNVTGEFDIATGRSISLNHIVDVLGVPAVYEEERKGDARHIKLDPIPAKEKLGFETEILFEEGIKEVW
jgi:UDP-glucose 4-epimerase